MPKDKKPTKKTKQQYCAHYISGTHWDREWYRPMQEFRLLLVQLMDELLDIMETNKDFQYFHLDGQTCMLQDYLDIRPENRKRLAKLIKAGRILIGPWFTMPDLFCVGDEALIRNLLLGRRICRDWDTEPMNVAYTCDMFGHPSQMPQIYTGFGLEHCVLGRGNNEHTTPPFFQWESPDGSRVLCFKLQDVMGYGALASSRDILEKTEACLRNPAFRGMQQELDDAGDDEKQRQAVLEKWCKEKIRDYVKHEMDRANAPVLCLMDALDHTMPAADVAGYIRRINEACPQVKAKHSSLPAFFADARDKLSRIPVRRGERREPARDPGGYLWLIPHCVSARVDIKQANDESESLLQRWVEPMLALANSQGADIPPRSLQVAWEHVLLNQAHDSICGCSIDQVHKDMMYRYDQARVLGRQLRHQCFAALTTDCADLAKDDDEFTVSIWNPLPTRRQDVVEFDLDFPVDYPATFKEGFRSQRLKAFKLEDADGNPVPYQRLSLLPATVERSHLAQPSHVHSGKFDRYRIAAQVHLPAMGVTALRVKPSDKPVRHPGSLRTSTTTAENKKIAIAIAPNGTLSITLKLTDQTYTDLLQFESRSEIGDGWFHGHSINDEVILSTNSPAQISIVHDGPELVTFRSTVTMRVPACYDREHEAPSTESVDLRISNLITLRRTASSVEVETIIDNTATDHRLRMLLPTDVSTAHTWLAHHPFDFVERPIALDPETTDWKEMDVPEKPFLGMLAVGGGKRGLAFISASGLHEGGVEDNPRRSLQVTLLRSFRQTVGTRGESDGLALGEHRFRSVLLPFTRVLPRTQALHEWTRLQADLLTRQTGLRSSGYPPMTGRKKPVRSFLELAESKLVLSAMKPADDGKGIIVRLWNPYPARTTERLVFDRPIKSAETCDLAENKDHALKPNGCEVNVHAAKNTITSVRLQF